MDGGGDNGGNWSPKTAASGDWTGWDYWDGDAFEVHAGPFYSRKDASGAVVCAFRAEAKHMNGGGFMHGGCLMTFADYALFAIGGDVLTGPSVTASLHGDFLDSASVGELIEATGEVVRAGGSMVFLRGLIKTGDRTLLSFSGIVKKVRARARG
jgi:acyl-coenzyme A thioesterase PaaI-like protein